MMNFTVYNNIGRWPNVRIILLIIRFSLQVVIHAYSSLHSVGFSTVHGWMTHLILLHKGILGHFMLKITKKHVFLDFLLENSFFEIGTQNFIFIF